MFTRALFILLLVGCGAWDEAKQAKKSKRYELCSTAFKTTKKRMKCIEEYVERVIFGGNNENQNSNN